MNINFICNKINNLFIYISLYNLINYNILLNFDIINI